MNEQASGSTGTENTEAESAESGSTLTVLLALFVNLGIAVMKAVAGVLTGSGAMLSEAAHSVADTFTELFLLTALRRSSKPADRKHPFGYGKERYFWSLLAAVSIFASGALFSFVEGTSSLVEGGEELSLAWVNYLVLGLAFCMESVSWVQAVKQVRSEAREEEYGFFRYVRLMDDPTPKTVLFEDSAALAGLLLAFGGTGLHQLTGMALFDGIASLLIGVLLALVALALGYSNRGLLIGRQADPKMWQALHDRLGAAPEVDSVVDLLTMLTGADRILLCARLDFDDALGAHDLELACVRITSELHEEFDELDEIFLEPIPRTDPALRERVLARYGELTPSPEPNRREPGEG